MTPNTEITLTLVQLFSMFSGIIMAAVFVVVIYWRLNTKIEKNRNELRLLEKQHIKEIAEQTASIKYDIDNRFAILSLERKNCSDSHTGEITGIKSMLFNNEKSYAAIIQTLTQHTKSLTTITNAFDKHLTYHETVENLKK